MNLTKKNVDEKKPSRAPQRSTSSTPEELFATIEKFRKYVPEAGDEECWLWLGSLNKGGYGVFRAGHRVVMAHRHMFELEHNRPASGMVLHTCGKKTCVNPKHLYEGSKANPVDADAVLLEEIERKALPAVSPARGRAGTSNPRAQLTEEQVKQICALLDQGVSPRVLGFIFGVDAKAIRNIDQGKAWRHVPEVARRAEAPKMRRRGGWRRRAR